MKAIIGRTIAIGVLFAALSAWWAVDQSTAAATAVPAPCSQAHQAASSHRDRVLLGLTPAKPNKVRNLCHAARQSMNEVHWWYSASRRWTLYPNQRDKTCWQLRLAGPLGLCVLARQVVRQQLKRLSWLKRRITVLSQPPPLGPKWLVDDFICIHQGEGAWNANTGNGYYGGLQMDQGFMARYGLEFLKRYGTADHWPIWAQLTAGIRAYRSGRGFYPWPNTAAACGLL